jgi:hypothetical protein
VQLAVTNAQVTEEEILFMKYGNICLIVLTVLIYKGGQDGSRTQNFGVLILRPNLILL